MNILVLGKGGREQAISKALSESPSVQKIWTPDIMGNEREYVPPFPWSSTQALQLISRKKIDLVVIGPEKELAEGVGDFFRSLNVPVFGPSKSASQLESSKLFAKKFMLTEQIPTAEFKEINSVQQIQKIQWDFPLVLKADGLAKGKGVFICHNKEDLEQKAHNLFEKKIFGPAGEKALIERFQTGWEMSVFVLLSHPPSSSFHILPFAKDYKKLKTQNQGPNTGGMGAFAPHFISSHLETKIKNKVILPTIKAITKHNFFYRGVLYIGLMILDNNEPQVLEYNVRFGDPETQVLMPLLEGDWGQVFFLVAQGKQPHLQWKKNHFATCVVLAGEGYPEKPSPSLPIQGDMEWESTHSYFLPAGAEKTKKGWFTKGGRVVNAIGLGTTKEEACQRAYEQASRIKWPGLQKRSDIGS